jgi:hypothetical protein
MLRTLVDEVPAEVRETKQSRRRRQQARLIRFGKIRSAAIPETSTILLDIDLISPGPTHSPCPPRCKTAAFGAS